MCLPTEDLFQIAKLGLSCALHKEENRIEKLHERIQAGKVVGSLYSDISRDLMRTLERFPHLVTDDLKKCIRRTEIYGIDIDFCNAFAARGDGRDKIIVLAGILKVIRAYADFIIALSLYAPRDTKSKDLFGAAVMASILSYIETGEGLINAGEILGDRARKRSDIAYIGAVVFLIAHEIGHLQLNHLEGNTLRGERSKPESGPTEKWNRSKLDELDADEFAFYSLNKDYRNLMISSILIMFGAFGFAQTFSLPEDESHPLVVNRIMNISRFISFDDDVPARTAFEEVTQQEIVRFNQLTGFRKHHNNASESIAMNMPLNAAHEIFRHIKEEIISEELLDDPTT